MKTIRFRCKCGTQLAAAVKYAGKKARCKNCDSKILIPGDHTNPATKQSRPALASANSSSAGVVGRAAASAGVERCESCGERSAKGMTVCLHCGYHFQLKRRLTPVENGEEVGETLVPAACYGTSLLLVTALAFVSRSLSGPSFLVLFFGLFCLYGMATPVLRALWADSDTFNYGALSTLLGLGVFRVIESVFQGHFKIGFLLIAMVFTVFLYSISLTQLTIGNREPPLANSKNRMSSIGFYSIFGASVLLMSGLFFVPQISQALAGFSVLIAVGGGLLLSFVWAGTFGLTEYSGSGGYYHSCSSGCSTGCGGGGCGGGCGGCGS